MEKEYDNILERLRAGEKIKCPKCHLGDLKPYNTSADKAHCFNCSSEKCNFHYQVDMIIDID